MHQDYVKFGDLNGVSTFPFENQLGILKRKVKGTNKVFEQVSTHAQRLNELDQPSCTKLLQLDCKRNSGVMLRDGRIAKIINKSEDLITLKIYGSKNLFQYPLNSEKVGVFKLKETNEVAQLHVREISAKVIVCPSDKVLVGIKLLSH